MVSHKRLEEFKNKACLLPANARAPRSVRKRRSFEKNVSKDEQMCAIDLLATVAEILQFEGGDSLMSIDKPVNTIEDNCVVTQISVKEEEKTLKPVTLSVENPYPGSVSPCGLSSVINGKIENEAEGFSNSSGNDSCQDKNFKSSIDGDAVVVDVKPNVLVSLGSSSRTELPVIGNCNSRGVREDVNLYSRNDDDEKFSGYIHPCVTKKSHRTVPRIGDRRIRKILASRHWKGSSRHADAKSWRNYPIKKWRYSDDYHLRTKMHRGSKTVSSMRGQGASFVASGSHVRMRIKSFRVPELYIEIPETATVGSLKRMVMEAVSSLLSDGHRVGLMVQGKKVRDDNKTLRQTGISQDNTHLDSLDFSLEPSSEKLQLLTSHPSGLACEELLPVGQVTKIDTEPLALLPSDSFGNRNVTDDLKSLVPVAPLTDMLPKSKKSEQAAQRRIRRPFSVAEVEALVQAVEKVGTGRWRDVKFRAFEDAEHRTYVDLKDKWKTLVHTAKISPQQRRGEPVPQELLNRVLNAHGYWSQQNMKNKQQLETVSQTEALLLLSN